MEVRTPQGYKPIAELSVTDKVLTNTGRYQPIEVLMSRVGESIYNLSFGGDYKNLRLTGEHPVEVLKDGSFVFTDTKDVVKGDFVRIVAPSEVNDILAVDYLASVPSFINKTETGYTRTVEIKRNRNAEPTRVRKLLIEWLEALSEPVIKTRDDLSAEFNCSTRVLDHVMNTLSAEAEIPFRKRIGATGYQKGSQVEWYPTALGSLKAAPEYGIVREEMFVTNTSIPVDNDLLYLIGYWLGDGTLARDSSREGVWGRGLWNIYFGEESSDKLSKVMGIIRRMLGEQCLKVWKDDRSITTVKVGSNPAFVEWWASNFGETSFGTNAKRIPQWVQELPSDKLMSLVAGLVDSDGSVGINTNSNSLLICLQLSSPTLIDQVRDVMLKCSCLVLRNHAELPQETMDAPIVGRICNKHKDVYKLLCSDEDSCKKILQYTLKQPKGDFRFTGPSTVAKRIGNDFALIVKNVEVQPGEVVYNLQVAVDHTFTVNGFSTHNCFSFVEDHDPYANLPKDAQEALKAKGKAQSDKLLKEFNITDKDPNYIGWTKILVLPPDQVRVTKIPFADNPLIEYVPDPETIAAIMKFEESHGDAFQGLNESSRPKVPSSILRAVSEGGAIPLDQDPYSGSFIYHLARKKSH
jgi:intein/homing endonuclease